ncbi:MAG: hypothetical protein ACJ74O_16310 [Frankiaceae bacterium]
MIPSPLLAHAFGVRYDLPLPLWLFVLGGAVVVIVSFLLVEGRAVRAAGPVEPRDRALPPPATGAARLAGALAVLVLALLIWAGLTGAQDIPENILPTWFWIVVWVVAPLTCGVLGNWTRPVNPYGWLSTVADRPGLRRALLTTEAPLRWPDRLGWWPAAVLLFATACAELVFNRSMTLPRNLALALLGYAVLCLVAGALFGRAWLERGEMLSVLLSTWGRLGFFRFGAPGRRGFAGGFDVPFEASASRIAFVLLLLVNVNFDGLLATPRWQRFEQSLPGGIDAAHADRLEAFRTLTFLVLALALAAVLSAFAVAAARAGRHGTSARAALAGLLPSILPIAFGYLLAHYFQYVLLNGQLLAPLIGNPVGKESWPIHLPYPFNDDYEPHLHFLPSGFYWYFAVVVIVAAHVVAVLVAHRHLATSSADRATARASERPWLVAMVGYTMLSLWLLAQPLVKESGNQPQEALPRPVATWEAGPPAGAP